MKKLFSCLVIASLVVATWGCTEPSGGKKSGTGTGGTSSTTDSQSPAGGEPAGGGAGDGSNTNGE